MGGALIEWGTKLADDMGLECFVSATELGALAYEKYGYVKSGSAGLPGAIAMVRPVVTKGTATLIDV